MSRESDFCKLPVSREERAFYDLERLWRDAPRLDWDEPDAVSSAR
jgi:hypothetical protein